VAQNSVDPDIWRRLETLVLSEILDMQSFKQMNKNWYIIQRNTEQCQFYYILNHTTENIHFLTLQLQFIHSRIDHLQQLT